MNNKPVAERIVSLDILRGFALLGILLMNIQAFSMPFAAYINPTAFGDLTGVNLVVWVASHILADNKFITLFSLLFGAGVVIFIDHAQARERPLLLYYRRIILLMLLGLFHAFFIWFGDILFLYALCGLWLVIFVDVRPVLLVVYGVLLNLIIALALAGQGNVFRAMPTEELIETIALWAPTASAIALENAALTGSVAQIHAVRVEQAWSGLSMVSGLAIGTTGIMFIGVALYKWDVLSARRSGIFYRNMVILGLAFALPLTSVGIVSHFEHQWDIYYSMGAGRVFNSMASLAMAMAYIGMVMLAIQQQWLLGLQRRLAAMGQMALSHYIGQSLLCTFVFYGYGLGLYGQLERYQQLLVVFAVWGLQLWFSPLWLARYRFGPLEWVWRCLTYWQWQQFRR